MNEQVKNIESKVLSDKVYTLNEVSFEQKGEDGETHVQKKEVYVIGDAATILLYNRANKTILLTKQFRMPTYLNGNKEGLLVETPAGKIDENETPEKCIIREVEEETGYRIKEAEKIMEAYTSPASLTEKMHFFLGAYSEEMKVSKGGGLKEEGEMIEVMEVAYDIALQMMDNREINDMKTLLLLQYMRNHLSDIFH